MAKDPDEIREEIEETRAEMGETVEALAYKTDVKTRAKDAIVEKKESLTSRMRGTAGSAGDRTTEAAESARARGRQAAGKARENPLVLAVGSAAVGFLAGVAMPSTRAEDEKVGPMAQQVKERARETGEEAVSRGKEVAQEAAQSAKETARERGQEHGQELSASVKERAQETTSQG